MTVLNDDFVFVHMPKNGGSMVEGLLKKHFNVKCEFNDGRQRHGPINEIEILDKKKRFAFGIIREPVDYWRSFWSFDKTKRRMSFPVTRKLFKPVGINNFNNFVQYCCKRKDNLSPILNFEVMNKLDIGIVTYRLMYLFCDPKIFKDRDWIKNFSEYFLLDYLLYFENLLEDLIKMFFNCKEYFPIDIEVCKNLINTPVVNASTNRTNPPEINEEILALIKHKERLIYKYFYKGIDI